MNRTEESMKTPALLAAAVALAAAVPAAAEEGKALRREVLENGAVILVKEDHNMPVVTLQAWFRVGSVTEGENLGQGLSHFVEHMIFKGTEKQKPGDYARAVRAAGGALNAYTHFERTVFHCTIRSEFFDPVLESFSDVIQHSKMDPEEAKKEQQVIVNELKMYLDDPNRLIQYAFNETAWRSHPCRHPIGGYLDQFLKLQPEEVGRYFRRFYVPNNMIFIVVGDVDGADAMDKAKKALAGFERKALPPVVLPEEPEQKGTRREVRTYPVKGASSGARLKMGWHGVDCGDAAAPALDMLALVMGYGESSRLTRRLKNEKRLVQSIYAGSDTPSYRGGFAIVATLDAANLEAVEKEVLAIVEEFKAAPVGAEELGRVLAAVNSYNRTRRQGVDNQADVLGQNEMYYGNAEYDEIYLARLNAVTPEELQLAARKYLVEGHLTVAAVVPSSGGGGSEVPAGAAKSEFKPQVEEFTLSNGMRVVFRQNPAVPAFGLTISFLAGSRLEPADKPGLANLASEMLLRGTKSRTSAQIADAISRTGGSFRVQGGRNTLLVNVEMLKEHLPFALELSADVLMNPAFDAGELDNVKRLVKFQIDRMTRDAGGATSIRFHRMIYGDHPYAHMPVGTTESVEKIGPEDLRAFVARFAAPDNCVVGVVGDLTAAELKAALERAFAGFKPAGVKLPEVPEVAKLEKGAKDDVTDPTKQMGVAMIGFQTIAMDHEDRWALQVVEAVMGGMGGRLWDEVREKRNLAYSVWASNVAMYEPGYFQFGVMAQGENLDEAVKTILAEVARISEGAVSDDELVDARNQAIGDNLLGLQKNSEQAQALALDTIYGMGPTHVFEIPKLIDKVTIEDLKRVAKKYFDPARAILVVTRPAGK
ncbi:MAG: insulinase family protein [Planctomycetes bacterium]|nr:insulinase family protein [Planctomycetota bacterium]